MKVNYYDRENSVVASATLCWNGLCRVTLVKRHAKGSRPTVSIRPYAVSDNPMDYVIDFYDNHVTIIAVYKSADFCCARRACAYLANNVAFK